MAEEEVQQCVFCHIATGKIPAKKVYEDDKVAAVLDINPGAPGHLLVMPKEHVAIMPQMSEDLVAYIAMIAKQLSHALIRALKVDGTSIFVANGVAAGQRAPHFLLHVIPRSKNDGIALQLSVVKIDEKSLKDVFDKLSPAVAKQFGVEPKSVQTEFLPKKAAPKEAKPESPKLESKEAKPEAYKLDDIAKFLTGGK